MTIHTFLQCFLCQRFLPLALNLVTDADIGTPRFWCRSCTSPRRLGRMLKKRIGEMTAQPEIPFGEDIVLARKALEIHTAIKLKLLIPALSARAVGIHSPDEPEASDETEYAAA
jgi:hypothetical protein